MRKKHATDKSAAARGSPQGVLIAAAVAIAALLVGGGGYRLLASYYARPVDSVPLPAGTLDRVPLRLGAWTGQDVALDKSVAEATDADVQLNRVYRQGGGAAASLYVAYGIRGRDLVPHRPEVCYPGAGWTIDQDHVIELALGDGTTMPCRSFRFTRGGMDAEAVRVLNFFIIDGRFHPDISELRSKFWKGSSSIRYMTRVMISCQDNEAAVSAATLDRACTLAREVAPAVKALMPAPQ